MLCGVVFSVSRCSDESGSLKVTEIGEKPLKREMLDTNVSLVRQFVLLYILSWYNPQFIASCCYVDFLVWATILLIAYVAAAVNNFVCLLVTNLV